VLMTLGLSYQCTVIDERREQVLCSFVVSDIIEARVGGEWIVSEVGAAVVLEKYVKLLDGFVRCVVKKI
jgi:hypothetical protein